MHVLLSFLTSLCWNPTSLLSSTSVIGDWRVCEYCLNFCFLTCLLVFSPVRKWRLMGWRHCYFFFVTPSPYSNKPKSHNFLLQLQLIGENRATQQRHTTQGLWERILFQDGLLVIVEALDWFKLEAGDDSTPGWIFCVCIDKTGCHPEFLKWLKGGTVLWISVE